MKNNFYRLLLYSVCSLLLFACQDENISPETQQPNIGGISNDAYAGPHCEVTLQDEMEGFRYSHFTCAISTEDGQLIFRRGEHKRQKGKSVLTFDAGLKEGVYRLLYLEATINDESADADTTWVEYGLGCRISFSATNSVQVLDAYNASMGLSGSGTEEDPFIVACSDHLKRIRNVTNDEVNNRLLTEKTHFRQTMDIDMDKASWNADHEFGWLPIGNVPNNPFRGIYDGGGYSIKNLWSKRSTSSGIALFGYTATAVLKNIRMVNPQMEGHYAVGSLLGAVVSAGDKREKTLLVSCTTKDGSIKTSDDSVGAGGLVGVVDMYGMCLLDSCINHSTTVSGDFAIGGLLGLGSVYSKITVEKSSNHADVTSNYTGAGGLVGTVDSLSVIGCLNTANIIGSKKCSASKLMESCFGTGGIAGGSGMSYIYASTNEGDVTGCVGVGGIIGSTRIGDTETLFNNTLTKSCNNTGDITGETAVGGICGEAQFGCYAVYNTGTVTATSTDSHVGGIVGNTSIAVVHNALNTGKVNASDTHCAGGIIGKTNWGAVFACQNLGSMSVKADYAGGIIGLAGNYTMMNYCYNAGFLTNSAGKSTGGIIGEIGDPRKWSALDIVGCVIGSVECLLSVAGPVLAIAGDAVKVQLEIAGETASTLAKAIGKLTYVLHVGEVGLEYILLGFDTLMLGHGVQDMLRREEAELMASSLKAHVTDIDQRVRSQMANLRGGHSLASDLFLTGLNADVTSAYMQHTDDLIAYYEADSDHTNTINYNLNNKREERYEVLEERRHVKETTHKVVAGVCIGISTVAAIAAIPVNPTSSAAIALAEIGAISTFLGGSNAIIEGATNFQNNVVVVSQCVNMGKVKADDSKDTGGIIGRLEQNGLLADCLNAGAYVGQSDQTGGLVGHASADSDIERSLHCGKGWGSPFAYSSGTSASLSANYFYTAAFPASDPDVLKGARLSLEELCDPKHYNKWNFNGDNAIWKVTNSKGYFPFPFHSEMQEEINEE